MWLAAERGREMQKPRVANRRKIEEKKKENLGKKRICSAGEEKKIERK
jgi:hypothetical protein